MDFYSTLLVEPLSMVGEVLNFIAIIFLLLFMNASSKHLNKKLSAWWYICGFLFPLITFFVFLSERKSFRSEKVCYQCGNKYPESFTECTVCNRELPVIDKEENPVNEKKAKGFCIGFVIAKAMAVISVIAMLVVTFGGESEDDWYFGNRIGVTDENGAVVYYDKSAKAYENPTDVLLYDKDGNVYEYRDSDELFGDVYVDENGGEYVAGNCYVDFDGNFYYDEDYELYEHDDGSDDGFMSDVGSVSDEEEFYEMWNYELENYRYYNDVYTDGEGNYYYLAEDASWNEKGEFITAENDPVPPETTAEATE